ncbi:GNAT family N-acetyltransferase [Dyadobacter sp. CY345]|uniref:GNAT family N-acetyltransferase n=1 Tax=Dyadobacter sp. CY345 TaxID=2909335 RepID=UPI001F41EBD9|nr:GNAT family N-acetyltransferase [Dyadobacter sp. CY345]MCF2447221.1 GNAT family N-acetyltransferase [Dyadobacter sp. CY345]
MSLKISAYTQVHTSKLREVFLESRKLAFPWKDPKEFRLNHFDEVIKDEKVLVALHDDIPIGFIAWWPPASFIHSLFIDPNFVGRGIGKLLLEGCMEQISLPASLKCLKANEAALRFYKKHSWVIEDSGLSPDGDYFLLSFGKNND